MATKSKNNPRGANKYTPPTKSSAPGWIWLMAGIVIGGFIMFLMKLEPKQDIRNPTTVAKSEAKKNSSPSNKLTFEFPQLLSGNDPGQILTEEHKKLDGERAAALLSGKPPPLPPANTTTPVSNTSPQATAPTSIVTTTTIPVPMARQQPQTQPTQVAINHPLANTKFFLQVGSYPTKNAAESTRAKILMSGQDVKLETTNANNKTWYRVLVGPFNTKEEATKVQQQLSSTGFTRTLLVPRKTQ